MKNEYIVETVNGKTKYYLMMYGVKFIGADQPTDYKQPVSKTEYQNYIKAQDFISALKETATCGS